MSTRTSPQEIGCFFCHLKISPQEKFVEWEGCHINNQPTIQMHARCAVMLGSRLIGDAFEANGKVDDRESVLDSVSSRIRLNTAEPERIMSWDDMRHVYTPPQKHGGRPYMDNG